MHPKDVSVPLEGVALFISVAKQEIYDFDLAGFNISTGTLQKWRSMNVGNLVLLPNGQVREIIGADFESPTWSNIFKSFLPFTCTKLRIHTAVSQRPFSEIKELVLKGSRDVYESFGGDADFKWKVAHTDPDSMALEIEACRSGVDLIRVLDLPEKGEGLSNL